MVSTGIAMLTTEWLSPDAREQVLSLVCTSVEDAVDGLLTEGADAALPLEPLSILESYAQSGLEALVTSDEFIPAVVAAHHLVFLGPKIDEDMSVPSSASSIWTLASSLPPAAKEKLSTAISRSLAELLGRVSCRAS